jgi:hypothetical protein
MKIFHNVLIWFKKQTQAGFPMWDIRQGVVKQHEPASRTRDGLQEGCVCSGVPQHFAALVFVTAQAG